MIYCVVDVSKFCLIKRLLLSSSLLSAVMGILLICTEITVMKLVYSFSRHASHLILLQIRTTTRSSLLYSLKRLFSNVVIVIPSETLTFQLLFCLHVETSLCPCFPVHHKFLPIKYLKYLHSDIAHNCL